MSRSTALRHTRQWQTNRKPRLISLIQRPACQNRPPLWWWHITERSTTGLWVDRVDNFRSSCLWIRQTANVEIRSLGNRFPWATWMDKAKNTVAAKRIPPGCKWSTQKNMLGIYYAVGFCGLFRSSNESFMLPKSFFRLSNELPPLASAAVGPMYLASPKPRMGNTTIPNRTARMVHSGTSLPKLFINRLINQIEKTMFTHGTRAATTPHHTGLPTISAMTIML